MPKIIKFNGRCPVSTYREAQYKVSPAIQDAAILRPYKATTLAAPRRCYLTVDFSWPAHFSDAPPIMSGIGYSRYYTNLESYFQKNMTRCINSRRSIVFFCGTSQKVSWNDLGYTLLGPRALLYASS